MDRRWKLFWAAFFLTLVLLSGWWAFLVTELRMREDHLEDAEPLVRFERTAPLKASLFLMGRELPLPLEQLNRWVGKLRPAAPFLLPAGVRLTGQLASAGYQGWLYWQDLSRERDYQQMLREEQAEQEGSHGAH